MLNNKTIAVVVPVYNEESQIIEVLKSIPDFVDRIIVVNDGSTDKTSIKIKNYIMNNHQKIKPIFRVNPKNASVNSKYNYADVIAMKMREKEEKYYVPLKSKFIRSESKVILLEHEYNAGVGAAITTGYKWCRDHGIDCVAVMAGDGQMDPSELKSICEPIIKGEADYVKGNRFIHRAAPLIIPKIRYIGNSILSILTKIASGYWHISDTQCGYTAISHKALEGLELYKIYKSYGMPNDLLVKLNIGSFTIKEVPIKPVYNIGEKSKMKIWKVVPKISLLLIKSFFKRLFVKYLLRNFHPLFICYLMFFLTLPIIIFLVGHLVIDFFVYDKVNKNYLIVGVFTILLNAQFLLFGMWFDMQDNERLQK